MLIFIRREKYCMPRKSKKTKNVEKSLPAAEVTASGLRKEVSGTVEKVFNRQQFTAAFDQPVKPTEPEMLAAPDVFYRRGTVVFETGANAGDEARISSNEGDNLTLTLPMDADISTGDKIRLIVSPEIDDPQPVTLHVRCEHVETPHFIELRWDGGSLIGARMQDARHTSTIGAKPVEQILGEVGARIPVNSDILEISFSPHNGEIVVVLPAKTAAEGE